MSPKHVMFHSPHISSKISPKYHPQRVNLPEIWLGVLTSNDIIYHSKNMKWCINVCDNGVGCPAKWFVTSERGWSYRIIGTQVRNLTRLVSTTPWGFHTCQAGIGDAMGDYKLWEELPLTTSSCGWLGRYHR